MAMVQQLVNDVLFQLREPGVNYGGVPTPNPNADYNSAVIISKLNDAMLDFVRQTGVAPGIFDTYVTLPIVAGQDFALPANLRSLDRVEYSIGGSEFIVLPVVSFDEFDDATGLQIDATPNGSPQLYREPYGTAPGSIRWSPVPTAVNVAAGDMVALYYSGDPLMVANMTDVPGIPAEYHEALSHFVLSRLWFRKNDPAAAKAYLDMYLKAVADAKAAVFERQRGRTFAFVDDEDTVDSDISEGSLGRY